MSVTLYTYNLDVLGDWETATWKMLLQKSTAPAFNVLDTFVADLVPATYEISAAGYSRATLASLTRSVFAGTDPRKITYDAADPNFGTPAAGQTYSSAVLFKFVTNDSDSLLIARYSVTPTATSGVMPPIAINSSGLLELVQV